MKDWIKVVVEPVESDVKFAAMVKKLYKTHEVKIVERGTIYIKRNDNNSRKN